MYSFQKDYLEKRTNAHDAIDLINDSDVIIVPTGVGEPPELLSALSDRRRELSHVRVSQILPLRNFDYFDPETANNVRHCAYFLGSPSRPGAQVGWVDYIPAYFYELPLLMRQKLTPTDVVFALASPMDNHGYFSISLGTDYTMEAIKHARVIVLEVNPKVPFTYGNCHVHISQITALVESEQDLTEVGLPSIGAVEKAIGEHVAQMIPNGATLQIGYGAIPDAVIMQLVNKENLGIHTEMVGDGIMNMIEAGVVTNHRKNYLPGKMLATFALGSKKLYEFMNRNLSIEMHPVDFTNDPSLAAKNNNLISINATMQIDLLGQCGSESLGHKPYSGTGGQSDFIRAANQSAGGKSFIVMPSTAKDGKISRIALALTSGTHVTTSKNDVNYVATEYGVVQLRGKSNKERANALISIAHPDFRDQLYEEAKQIKLL